MNQMLEIGLAFLKESLDCGPGVLERVCQDRGKPADPQWLKLLDEVPEATPPCGRFAAFPPSQGVVKAKARNRGGARTRPQCEIVLSEVFQSKLAG